METTVRSERLLKATSFKMINDILKINTEHNERTQPM